MNTDLVTRLRVPVNWYFSCTTKSSQKEFSSAPFEAADEIEALRADKAKLEEALTEARVSLDRVQRVTFELAGYGENETDAAMADFVTANPAFRKIDAAFSHLQKRR